MVRRLVDALLTGLAHVVLRGFFRSVEVHGTDRVPVDRPLIFVANHFYGFIDPVMLVRVIGRLPRFLAKSTLWDVRWLRPFLHVAGLIPVYRRQDRPSPSADGSDNIRAFSAAEKVLERGGVIGIFPEGRSHDESAVSRVHTGAARIALGARAAGVRRVTIVPVGLTFDDKISLRSRVLAVVADPIDVENADVWDGHRQPSGGDEDRQAVRKLTDLVARGMRSVAPDYRSFREARVMAEAAEIALRPAGDPRSGEVPLAERERLARRLAQAGARARDAITDAVAQYYLDLHVSGLREEQVGSGYRARRLLTRTLATALAVTVMAPFALVGAIWNVVPFALVTAVSHIVQEPVRKGTARLSAALVLFPAMWTVVAITDPWRGLFTGVAVFLAAPFFGLIAVAVFERGVDIYIAWRGWIGLAERRALLNDVRRSRSAVVEAVRAACAGGEERQSTQPVGASSIEGRMPS